MSRAAVASGREILIFTSSRPALSTAGSMRSCRLLAPMTITLRRLSIPSISERNCGTIVDSTSEEMPVPRVRNRASISSKNTMTGLPSAARSLAFLNTSRTCRSDSPTYLFNNSGPLTCRKKLRTSLPLRWPSFFAIELATALAINVFPQPGGPYSRTPFGGLPLVAMKRREPAAPLEKVFQADHFALSVEPAGLDDVERLVEDHLLSFSQFFRPDRGVHVDLHLAARHIHVRRRIGVQAGKNRVGGRGSGQLVHFRTERLNLCLGVLQRGGQFFILLVRLLQLIP